MFTWIIELIIIGYILLASTLITNNSQVIIPLYDSFSSVSISSLCKISYITPESFNKLIANISFLHLLMMHQCDTLFVIND